MALFLVRRTKKSNNKVDMLLVSSTDRDKVECTMWALYPDYTIEVPHEEAELNEQLFNINYGGIAVLTAMKD